ncbi:MAG: glutathione S-transferase family protein [Granulosicoccus sp.]
MKLFGHPESGHAFKVAFYLAHYDVPHEYEYVDIFIDRQARQEEFRANASYGEVPLLLHDGRALTQSNSILLYLAQRFQNGLGNSQSSEQHCTQWLLWEANKIGLCLPQLRSIKRYETNDHLMAAQPWLLERYRHDVQVLEQNLSDGRSWMVEGSEPSIADFSLFGYLVFADEAEVDVPPKTTAWLQRMKALDAYQHPYDLLK